MDLNYHFTRVIILVLIWSVIWKGLALWKSAGRREKWWFIVFFLVSTAGTSGTLGWFELETGTTAEAWNNIFFASANTTQTAGVFNLLDTYCYSSPCGTLRYSAQNWISPLFGTVGVNGSATDPSFVNLSGNDVHIHTNNVTIVGNGQTGNPAYPATVITIPLQYLDFLGSSARPFSASSIDLGAFGFQP